MKFTSNITRDSNSDWKCVVWDDSVKGLEQVKQLKLKLLSIIMNFLRHSYQLVECICYL